jgi:hypothetical protein
VSWHPKFTSLCRLLFDLLVWFQPLGCVVGVEVLEAEVVPLDDVQMAEHLASTFERFSFFVTGKEAK